jgi:hypothetical protein
LTATALRLQPASGTERLKQAAKQAVMIEHPMEGGGADDAVESGVKREVKQIGSNYLDSLAELRLQVFAGRARHVLRNVECDHASFGQGLEQVGGKAAGASSGVENQFVALQPQTGEDPFSPTDLRLREAVVFGGIPFAGGVWGLAH